MQDLDSGWIDFGEGMSVQIHENGAHWRVIDARQESQRDGEITEVRLVVLPPELTTRIFMTLGEAIGTVRTWCEIHRVEASCTDGDEPRGVNAPLTVREDLIADPKRVPVPEKSGK